MTQGKTKGNKTKKPQKAKTHADAVRIGYHI